MVGLQLRWLMLRRDSRCGLACIDKRWWRRWRRLFVHDYITSFGCGVGGGSAKGSDEAVSVRHFFAADADGFIEKNSNREKNKDNDR